MKRSTQVRLLMLGPVGLGLLSGCSRDGGTEISENCAYSNNQFIAGAGYYHAPFRAFYARPLNEINPENRSYFVAGQWLPQPYPNIVNVSSPTPEAARNAQAARAAHESIQRGGFGSHGYGGHIWS